ncbi:MAG: phosphoribosylformylglycinamidine synthase subunit PurL [Candidatus Abyssobacteria bacterium SURF_5]|uniref:Phosphoribosylformylglycinamidine synthase subunit PurL n=1 Tax=Abyssobacteria bacterium (strain SURF_5) TaxID=2093360 RepID=A0A3A4NXB7_ABYX5|nr:MAG: phosphoribosylformylglycinamidine synthase subunit PurL [Candidatus Abyssubacteria bacterium SURF_5]
MDLNTYRIEVGLRRDQFDAAGDAIRKNIVEDLHIAVDDARLIRVYTLLTSLRCDDADMLRTHLFADPVIDVSTLDQPLASDFSWVIEIGFKPGVTDNVGKTSREAMIDIFGERADGSTVFTAKQYVLRGRLERAQVERIAGGLLANGLIEQWRIADADEFRRSGGISLPLPLAGTPQPVHVKAFDLAVSDQELIRISREGILSLSLDEMRVIRNYFRSENAIRDRSRYGLSNQPTDVELECIAQTWSEHCKHKIFNAFIDYEDEQGRRQINGLFKTYIRRSTDEISKRVPWLVSVFHDNAGVIRFNDRWNLVMKVETHNSPSALDPYGGAVTGIVGVNRDPFGTGKGCRLIFNVDTFCFAPPDYDKPLPPRLLHPKRIFKGVHRGVRDGANQSGIPDVNGSILFDDRYAGKPLVFCGTGGLMPKEILGEPAHEKTALPGDLIVMTGGRIGKDGIHGATFSSEELHSESPTSAVQIGDAITQKKMTDFLLEARDLGLYRAITDNGAGGLSSSVGEMARFSNGCRIELEKAPLKYKGLQPWEILLSEAQERMTLAVDPEKIDRFLELARRRDVEATVLGTFADSGKFEVLYESKVVAHLDMDFLHEGVPRMNLQARWKAPKHEEPDLPEPQDYNRLLEQMLARLNVCSKESFVRQYDHEVQGLSALKPFIGSSNDGPGDAAVLKPLYDSYEGVVVASGICPRYSDLDTYHMTACAIDEAVRNAISVGGRLGYLAGLDNFCWPDPVQSEKTPDGYYKLAQLVRSNMALYDYCTAYDVPCISGKDSMKNDYMIGDIKISVPPTLLFSVLGRIEDVRKVVSMDVKRPSHLVYVVGVTKNELGGSEYFAHHGFIGNSVPRVNSQLARQIYSRVSDAIDRRLIASCHDCSDGGLGVALAESAFAGGFGITADLSAVPQPEPLRADYLLFSESQSRFVITVPPRKAKEFEQMMDGVPFARAGKVTRSPLLVLKNGRQKILSADIFQLKRAWQQPLNW